MHDRARRRGLQPLGFAFELVERGPPAFARADDRVEEFGIVDFVALGHRQLGPLPDRGQGDKRVDPEALDPAGLDDADEAHPLGRRDLGELGAHAVAGPVWQLQDDIEGAADAKVDLGLGAGAAFGTEPAPDMALVAKGLEDQALRGVQHAFHYQRRWLHGRFDGLFIFHLAPPWL